MRRERIELKKVMTERLKRARGWARALFALVVTLHCLASLEFGQQRAAGPQQPAPYTPQMLSELKRIQQAALDSDYAYRQVAHLSDNIGPRLSGSPQAQKAVEYVADEMRRLGLEVKLEKL